LQEERPNPACCREDNGEKPTLDVVTRLDEEDNAHDEKRDPDDKQADREQLDLEQTAFGHGYPLSRGKARAA
jgi:hypothetical protein